MITLAHIIAARGLVLDAIGGYLGMSRYTAGWAPEWLWRRWLHWPVWERDGNFRWRLVRAYLAAAEADSDADTSYSVRIAPTGLHAYTPPNYGKGNN